MRAALTRDKTLHVTELPDPTPLDGQVLVRTLACGICGSDLHALSDPESFMETARRSGGHPYDPRDGLVFGHEFSAEIIAYGPNTQQRLPVGAKVCGPPIGLGPAGAGIIGYAPMFPGGYGELMVLTEGFVMEIPNGLDPKVAAITEPFAVAHRAVERAEVPDDSVAVVLGLGPIGLAVVATLKARGHGHVIAVDFSPRRRELAEHLGADEIIDPAVGSPYDRWAELGIPVSAVEALTHEILGIATRKAVIFECVGVAGLLQQIVEGAPAGSTVMIVGVCMSDDVIMPGVSAVKELTLRGTFGTNPAQYQATLRDIAEGLVDAGAIITATIGLDGLANAFAELASPNTHAKIVVDPSV